MLTNLVYCLTFINYILIFGDNINIIIIESIRVSTDNKEQLSSYETQVNYYTKYINSKADWNFEKVYTDERISGTSTKKREGFKSIVSDALDGEIDLIITKSVSRFARNTVDSLTTVRLGDADKKLDFFMILNQGSFEIQEDFFLPKTF